MNWEEPFLSRDSHCCTRALAAQVFVHRHVQQHTRSMDQTDTMRCKQVISMSPSSCLLLRAMLALYQNILILLRLTCGRELQVFHTNLWLCGPFTVVSCNSKTHLQMDTWPSLLQLHPVMSHPPFITPGSLILSSSSSSDMSTGPASVYAALFRNL